MFPFGFHMKPTSFTIGFYTFFYTQELCGLLFPTVLLREYQALSPAISHQEFTFARFVIGSYIFCALPMPDLISVLFSTIKQTAKAKRYLSIDTMIPLVTVHNVIRILSDDLDKSAALLYILHSLHKQARLHQVHSSCLTTRATQEESLKHGTSQGYLRYSIA